MPITGPSSFVPTINQFVPHWISVNTALGPAGPLVAEGGGTVGILTGQRDDLLAFAASITDRDNDVQLASGNITLQKEALVGRLGEFNRKVRGFLSTTAFVNALPDVPGTNSGEAVILKALDDMKSLWTKINAATIPGFTGPLLLLGGYAVATFSTELATLKTAYETGGNAEQAATLERERRNDVQDLAYAVMLAYRKAVLGTFAPTDALVASLPKLTPDPGSTPDAVIATIHWIEIMGKAHITFTASTAADVAQYELRFCAGPHYSTDTETVIGNIGSSAVREFFTDAGLAAVGDTATFKVYVITTSGNEKGSNTVTLTRPAAV